MSVVRGRRTLRAVGTRVNGGRIAHAPRRKGPSVVRSFGLSSAVKVSAQSRAAARLGNRTRGGCGGPGHAAAAPPCFIRWKAPPDSSDAPPRTG